MHLVGFVRNHRLLVLGGLAVLVVAGALAAPLFLPKASTRVDQAPPPGMDSAVVKQGAFRDGAPGHHVAGTAKVVRDGDAYVLRLENYEATDGPDVYFYLTEGADPRSVQQVESGLRVLVPGGDEDGEATLRGNFNVPLPQGFDPARYQGVAAWCDRFNVLFGSAALA